MIERLRHASPAILRGVGVCLVAVAILAGVVWLVSRGQSEAAIGLGALAFAALTVLLGYVERTKTLRHALYEKRLEIYPELLTAVLKVEAVASEATLFQVAENAEGQALDDDQRRTINVH